MPTTVTADGHPWWKDAVVYQVYPASYMDSNGDGLGDIPGIISKLDYIKSIGTDVVWLCPMYDSPQKDLGYDIADYEAIYQPYGTMEDMQDLIDGCHARGMRIIADLVVNHTSSDHKWFQESKSSKNNDKRDWYIWRPAKYDAQGNRQPPNNWRSFFGGSAWQWDDATEEYYLHLFVTEQPDLNWENPATRAAICASAVESWMKRGVDGFRIDVVNSYSKVAGLPDAPVTDPDSEFQVPFDLVLNGPRIHEFISEIYRTMEPYDTMTVGECPNATPEKVLKYVSPKEKQLDMVFQFDLVQLGWGKGLSYDIVPNDWSMSQLKNAVQNIQGIMTDSDGWTSTFIENHDQARSISRFASDKPEYRTYSGKLLALFTATLSGTLFIYQGQEIGMINMPLSWPIKEYKDVASINFYKEIEVRTNKNPEALEKAKRGLQHIGRDNSRLPMSWDSSPQGGFSTNPDTWMRVHDLAGEINVAKQENDEKSVLGFWKRILKIRKQYSSLLVHGGFEIVGGASEDRVFAYTKKDKNRKVALVVLNFSEEDREWEVPETLCVSKLTLFLSTYEDAATAPEKLRPYEGRLYIQ